MTELKTLQIKREILHGITEYSRTYFDKFQNVDKIVNDTTDKVIQIVEGD